MRPSAFLALFLLGLAGCDASTTTAPPVTGGGPLVPGTWYMHTADGDTLPAKISTRIVGVAQEITYLDSAQLVIRADLTYEQRYWTRTTVTTILDRTDAVIDLGTFTSALGGFNLSSSVRSRLFTMSVPSLGNLTTREQMVFFESDPPVTTGTYKLSRP